MLDLYTTEGINRAIEIAERSSQATMKTLLSTSASAEEVEKMMPTMRLLIDLFVSNFKSVLYEGRGGRPSVKKGENNGEERA